MKHEDIWRALIRSPLRTGCRVGLARRSGLTPPPSTLEAHHAGRPWRWPSTESVAKVLDATGASPVIHRAGIRRPRTCVNGTARNTFAHPLIGFAQAGGDGFRRRRLRSARLGQ
jgi:hypothetical protein